MMSYSKFLAWFSLSCCLLAASVQAATIEIPITHHVSRNSSGSAAVVTTQEINDAMLRLNEVYNEFGVHFVTHQIRYINSTSWYEGWDSSKYWTKLNDFTVSNTLNVFYMNSISGNGKANFPYRQRDYIFVRASRLPYTTLIHEVGHYFGLLHTYSSSRQGPNCATSGDLICDTAYDPGGDSNFDSTSCRYIGDPQYNPDGRNFMSDANSRCRTRFSSQQKERLRNVAINSRFYLGSQIGGTYQPSFGTVRSFPHSEGFEPNGTRRFSWQDDVVADDYNWWFDTAVDAVTTGPQQGGARSSSHFLYTDRSGEAGGRTTLLSPRFDFNGYQQAKIRFYYFMYGSSSGMGELKLQIRRSGSSDWATLWKAEGKQHERDDDWQRVSLTLPEAYQDRRVQFRFVAVQGSSGRGIIALDDIKVSVD